MIEPLTLEQVKTYLRVDNDAEDDLIANLITGAREHIENECDGLVIMAREIIEPVALGGYIDLCTWPIAAASDIAIVRTGDDGVDADVNGWRATNLGADLSQRRPVRVQSLSPGWGLVPGDHPAAARAVIQAGFAQVPQAILSAILMLVRYWYAQGTDAATMPPAVTSLLRRYRIERV